MLSSGFHLLLAHVEDAGTGPHNFHELARSWGTDPGTIIPIALSGLLYAIGLRRLWKSSDVGRGIKAREAWSFAGGWFALVVALVSPLHPWGRVLFAAHMTQHEVLMLIAAPLLVLGRPMIAFLWALPSDWSSAAARAGNARSWQVVWQFITHPFVAWLIHAIALWIWHVPALFEATLHSEFIHALQHIAFLGSALLFWWAVIYGPHRSMGYGMAVLYLFTTALHSGILGAMLTFASRLWYPSYAHTTFSWGLSPVDDQQLGGLIMWIPAGVIYIVAGQALFIAWLRESERRAVRAEKSATTAAVTAAMLLLCCAMLGCDDRVERQAAEMTGGSVDHGKQLIEQYGCAGCHEIPGVRGATATVGPSLDRIAVRTYIAGVTQNTPLNMTAFLQNPKHADRQSAMPSLHVTESDARDMAAYLYTLK